MNADNSHQTTSAGKGALNGYSFISISSMDAEEEDNYNFYLLECTKYGPDVHNSWVSILLASRLIFSELLCRQTQTQSMATYADSELFFSNLTRKTV